MNNFGHAVWFGVKDFFKRQGDHSEFVKVGRNFQLWDYDELCLLGIPRDHRWISLVADPLPQAERFTQSISFFSSVTPNQIPFPPANFSHTLLASL